MQQNLCPLTSLIAFPLIFQHLLTTILQIISELKSLLKDTMYYLSLCV